jgi:2-polyprenyl-3-methyl-5-hydroxy-6-metoxy-1,4-benzoquinol methylase
MTELCVVPCPLCGCESFAEVYADHPSSIVRCRSCDLAFFNPQPTPEYLSRYYSSQEGYLPSAEVLIQNFRERPEAMRQNVSSVMSRLYSFRARQPQQRLLDVGCAYGFFLLVAREAGLEVQGVELSEETSRYAREQGVPVQTASLETAQLPDAAFDFITMDNMLEHTLDPSTTLARAFALLQPGGLAHVAVPNFDSLVSRADNMHWKNKAWPNHLFYFTPKTLSLLMMKAGFEVVDHYTHVGENEYSHDQRVVRDRLFLEKPEDVAKAIGFLAQMGKGQELVMIGRKPAVG